MSELPRAWLRGGLLALTALHFTLACAIILAPRNFYGRPWVSMGLPYNEHLLLDFGAMNLALAVVLGAAVRVMERRLITTALVSTLVFWAMHFLIHLRYLRTMSAWDEAMLMTALGLTALAPLGLLVVLRRVAC